MENNNRKNWWKVVAVVAVILLLIGVANMPSVKTEETQNDQSSETEHSSAQGKRIIGGPHQVIGGQLGEYGKAVVLNANTDMPTTKYIYKFPAGNYEVSVQRMGMVYTVKDTPVNSGVAPYTEELQPVDVRSFADPAEVFEMTLAEDESFLVLEGEVTTFTQVE